ncbi:VRR-NUC domain-containing protein [Pedobacter cryoconitis]|uniref:VRR-NUC domain-containing protein n=1 Tax=Pedobacter cryoconitis TaxID=188932 RepID=A0A327STB5_9SPHI|nr:VRR-NUC domain-containing protein [Pedobacter cryoconitis]RAJ28897.1 VRR-NUC domain-containing protein [Pedobacter cryoconitis]
MREKKQSEDDFQKECVRWIELQYPKLLVHHSPNGGKRNAREALKFKKMGTRAGCPDLMIYKKSKQYAGLAIELKVGTNGTTENQDLFLAELTANGWYCIVIRKMDIFMQTVKEYMSDAI